MLPRRSCSCAPAPSRCPWSPWFYDRGFRCSESGGNAGVGEAEFIAICVEMPGKFGVVKSCATFLLQGLPQRYKLVLARLRNAPKPPPRRATKLTDGGWIFDVRVAGRPP